MKKVWYLVIKELRQVMRDSNMLGVIFVVPLIQLVVLGYAITTDIKNLDILICDFDGSSTSRELIERFSHNAYLTVQDAPCRPNAIEPHLFRGEAVLALVIPKDFEKDLINNAKPEIQILIDGQNSNTGAVALGYCNRILLQFMQDVLEKRLIRTPALMRSIQFIQPVSRVWYNPELKSVYYMIPGIISILLTIITMLLTSLSIVKEKEIGTLAQLMVTPLTSVQVIAGKTIPFALLGFLEMAIAMTFGVLWFRVPIVGSIPLLAGLSATYILTSLGLGIFISTLVDTQQQALFMSWFFLVTFILLSGFFYPIENMPEWVQVITYGNPLRYFIEILRELFLKGAGLSVLWKELCSLLGMGAGIFILATLRFHRRTA
jgi:ABC-2 type transport system permease protein